MSKISVKSKSSVNMSHVEYMHVHRRMYAIVHDGSFRVFLRTSPVQNDVYVEVTESAFNSYLNYEIDFSVMLSIFACLCMKYGSCPCPF